MEIVTIGFIVILNLISIFILYKSLGNIETKNKLAITIIGTILMYIILYTLYGISSKGIEEKIVDASRQIIIFTFLPINVICIITPIIMQLKKHKLKEKNSESIKYKIILFLIIGIIILIIEGNYIKNIQIGIENFNQTQNTTILE